MFIIFDRSVVLLRSKQLRHPIDSNTHVNTHVRRKTTLLEILDRRGQGRRLRVLQHFDQLSVLNERQDASAWRLDQVDPRDAASDMRMRAICGNVVRSVEFNVRRDLAHER
jgi:hypothetical protein